MMEKMVTNIINESDGQELYRMACDVKCVFAQPETPDVNVEWQRFSTRYIPSKQQSRRKLWAIAVSILLVVGVCMAAIIPHFSSWQSLEQTSASSLLKLDKGLEGKATMERDSTFVFDHASLESILQNLSEYYQVRVEFKREEARKIMLHVEMDKSWSLRQMVQFLNHFDKVNISLSQENLIMVE
ncbi:MAG: DUF4974 domain-containing protein [Bacteroidaceae bacterium]|nr:DUF4974 domain-containing protein [Bacteroidaceae bacterium]